MEQPKQPKPAIAICKEPGYVEAFKRYLVEDALIVIASELLNDAASIAAMQRLGVYERLVMLMRAVMHWRANPETDAEGQLAKAMRHLPIAARPEPFDKATELLRKDPHTS